MLQDDTPFGLGGRRSSTPHAFSMLKPPGSASGKCGEHTHGAFTTKFKGKVESLSDHGVTL